jgi:bifunctional non-homologous end joining protein LigD
VSVPQFIRPQLSLLVEKLPSGPQWVHEIKLDGFRMAARMDNGRVQLLTRTGLDWTGRYPSAVAALANVKVKTAYLDGELCGVDEAGLPSFAHTQAATDGERGVNVVYYAFDLLHLAAGTSRAYRSSGAKSCLSLYSRTSPAFNSMATIRATANSS